MAAELKPCPFCGSKNAAPYSVKSCHSVLCVACGGEGPEADSEEGAIAAWNLRTPGVMACDTVELTRLADAFERSADWLDKGVLTGSRRTHPLVEVAAPPTIARRPKPCAPPLAWQNLSACKASDPYRTKTWIPHMRGKWMTVNVPTDLWERIQAAAATGVTAAPTFSQADVEEAAKHCGISDGHRDLLAHALRDMHARGVKEDQHG
jgi:Lar family restriction alleviation protein